MIQRIRYSLDQKLTDFSQILVPMIQYTLSFYLSLLIFIFLGVNTAFADNLPCTSTIPPSSTFNAGDLSVNFTDEEEPSVVLSTPENNVDTVFPVSVEFSEPVTGLEVDDFNISNGAGVELTGSEMNYTLMVNPGAVGAVSVFLPAAAVIDTAGNPNLVSNFLQINFGILDTTPPEVALSTATTEVSDAFIVEIRSSEEITGLELSDFSVSNAELSNLSGVDNVFTLLATPIEEGTITIQLNAETIVDLFDNPNGISNELVLNYLIPLAPDTIRPTIILADRPTTVDGTYEIKLEFSESVTELTATDLNLNNAVLTSFSQINQIYTIELTAVDFGLVEFSISENVVTDEAGNGNTHDSPMYGLNYYYIRQYDQLGDYVDSETAIFDFLNRYPSALVYPNPASTIITLNTTEYAGVRCEIMIYNSLGQIFLLDVYDALPNTPIELDVSDFQEGMYGVQFWIKETARVADSFMIVR